MMTLALSVAGTAIGLAGLGVALLQLRRTPKPEDQPRAGLLRVPSPGAGRQGLLSRAPLLGRKPAPQAGRGPSSGPSAELPAAPGAGTSAAAPVQRLIGRDSEMALLAGLAHAVAGGQGGSLLIEGEPGIGKSALARSALGKAAGAGCQVFWGSGDELGQALPLLPLLEALRVRDPSGNPRREAIVRLLRGETDHGTDVLTVLSEQLLTLVAESCASQPTILVIDDLQWADQASVALWRRLARLTPQMPLLLIGTMRPAPQRDDLQALRSVNDVRRLELAGLAEPAVAELIAGIVGGKPDHALIKLA